MGVLNALVVGDTPAPAHVASRTNRAENKQSRAGDGDVQPVEESKTKQSRALVAYRKCEHVLRVSNMRSCHAGAAQRLTRGRVGTKNSRQRRAARVGQSSYTQSRQLTWSGSAWWTSTAVARCESETIRSVVNCSFLLQTRPARFESGARDGATVQQRQAEETRRQAAGAPDTSAYAFTCCSVVSCFSTAPDSSTVRIRMNSMILIGWERRRGRVVRRDTVLSRQKQP